MKKMKTRYVAPDVSITHVEDDTPLAYVSWRTPDGEVLSIKEGDPPANVSAKSSYDTHYSAWET